MNEEKLQQCFQRLHEHLNRIEAKSEERKRNNPSVYSIRFDPRARRSIENMLRTGTALDEILRAIDNLSERAIGQTLPGMKNEPPVTPSRAFCLCEGIDARNL